MTITHSPEGLEHRPFDGPYFILEGRDGTLTVLHEDRQWIALFTSESHDRCERFIRELLEGESE